MMLKIMMVIGMVMMVMVGICSEAMPSDGDINYDDDNNEGDEDDDEGSDD